MGHALRRVDRWDVEDASAAIGGGGIFRVLFALSQACERIGTAIEEEPWRYAAMRELSDGRIPGTGESIARWLDIGAALRALAQLDPTKERALWGD